MALIKDWLGTFLWVFIKPTNETFTEEAEKSKGKLPSAYFILVLIVPIIFFLFFDVLSMEYESIYFIIIISLLFPLDILFYVFCLFTIHRKMFNRKKYIYPQLLYLLVSVFFVYCMLSLAIAFLPPPYSNIANIIISLYALYLNVAIYKALTKLKLWQSIVSIVLGLVLAAFGFFCIPTFFLLVVQQLPPGFGGLRVYLFSLRF